MAMAGRRTPTMVMLVLLGGVALAAVALPPKAHADEVTGYAVWADFIVNEDKQNTGTLYSIELTTGRATPIGHTGSSDVKGLAFSPDGTLYGVDETADTLLTIDPSTGAGTTVGSLGADTQSPGLTFDCDGNLWMSSVSDAGAGGVGVRSGDPPFYSIDPRTGAATEIGRQGIEVSGLAARGNTVFGLAQGEDAKLVTIDTSSGLATEVGPLNIQSAVAGLAFAPDGTLWGIEQGRDIYTVDIASGSATVQATVDGRFPGLAIPGGPVCSAAPSASGSETTGGTSGSSSGQDLGDAQAGAQAETGPGAEVEEGAPGSADVSDRSRESRVADRAPTVEGVGIAGDPDAVAGQASDREATDGWAAAFLALGIVGGLAVMGIVGRRRLTRSRS